MKRISKLLVCIFIICIFSLSGINAYADVEQAGITFCESVYLGGYPIGISTLGSGLYVDDIATIKLANGEVTPLEDKGISKGDVLLKVNGKVVSTKEDVGNAVKGEQINKLRFKGADGEYSVDCNPVYDEVANAYLLGLYLSNSVEGIGTVTFLKQDGVFSALGHPVAITDSLPLLTHEGKVFACTIDSVTPSRPYNAGQLNGRFDSSLPVGQIIKNSQFGIVGKLNNNKNEKVLIQTANRLLCNIGKACIYTTIKGSEPDYYDIEILSLSVQPRAKEKGILFKVTDKRLLAQGGIVQGMSGSPIIQNGKLVGAVTHVLVEDTAKGYGIYVDFLLDNL